MDERSKKTSKIGGAKTREQGKKTQMVGKEEKNKNTDFHEMATKFICPNQVCFTPLNDNPSVGTRFDCYCWMVNKMDSILAIR